MGERIEIEKLYKDIIHFNNIINNSTKKIDEDK